MQKNTFINFLNIANKFAKQNNWLQVRNILWQWFETLLDDNKEKEKIVSNFDNDELNGINLLLQSCLKFPHSDALEIDRSIKILKFCILINKNNFDLYNYLGKFYILKDDFDNAKNIYEQALNLDKNNTLILQKYLAMKILAMYNCEEIKSNTIYFQRTIKKALNNFFSDTNQLCFDELFRDLIIYLHYSDKYSEEQLSKLTFEYGNILSKRAEFQYSKWENINFKDKNSRLKIGLLPGNFNDGSMGVFFEGVFKNIDKNKLEIFVFETDCYKRDYLTDEIIQNLEHFIPCKDKTYKELAEFIYNNGIQILVDLLGFFPGHRLPVFAYKPAPIQITWMGYWATTGLETMDYIIGDNIVTPENEYHHYVEKVYKLPHCFFHLSTPNDAYTNPLLEVKETPFIKNGYITFGNFSYPAKQTDNVIKVWAGILNKVPNSKLMLKYFDLDRSQNQTVIIQRFQKYGINKDRLIFEGGSKRYELLNAYNKVDYTLDTFPYIGGTSTLQSIFMGVPVITKKGNSYLSHIG